MNKSLIKPLTVAIIGGGVAAMSCALWLKNLGFTPVIIEKETQLGGQLLGIQRLNRWVLGWQNKTSAELAALYAEHIKLEEITVIYQAQPVEISNNPYGYEVVISVENHEQQTFQVCALIIATGVRVLGTQAFETISGFQSLYQAGLIGCLPLDHLDKLTRLQGQTVAIIGGGDNAHYTAKDLALAGIKSHLIMRSQPKARQSIRHEIEDFVSNGSIIEHPKAEVKAFQQNQGQITIDLINTKQLISQIHVDAVFVRIGYVANTEFIDTFEVFSTLAKQAGYITTDASKRTSIPLLYAIGDVANRQHQSVVGAIAEGAIVAQDISERMGRDDQ